MDGTTRIRLHDSSLSAGSKRSGFGRTICNMSMIGPLNYVTKIALNTLDIDFLGEIHKSCFFIFEWRC